MIDPAGLGRDSFSLPQTPSPIATIWTELDSEQHLLGATLSWREGWEVSPWRKGEVREQLQADSVTCSALTLNVCHCSFPTQALPLAGSVARIPAKESRLRAAMTTPYPTLEKPEASMWAGGPASLPGGGVWLAQDPWWWGLACPHPSPEPPGPSSGPPPFLAGSLFLAGCSRSEQRGLPPSPLLASSPYKPCTKAAPRPPIAHSPQVAFPTGPCLFLSCSRCGVGGGTSPSTAADSCLSDGPSSMAVVRPAGPPPRGLRGTSRGKHSFATFPSPGWGLSQAINAGQPHHCANSPSRTGWAHPQPPPSQAGGFFLALPGCVKQKAWNGGCSKRGNEKGGLSLSLPPPHCFKGSPFPSPREKAFTFKKSPHWI